MLVDKIFQTLPNNATVSISRLNAENKLMYIAKLITKKVTSLCEIDV